MYNSIKPLRYYCQKVLPLVYDDSLSYYEVLGKTTEKLNEVIKSINDLSENIDDLIAAAIEEFGKELKAELQITFDDINNRIDETNNKILQLTGRINDDEVLINEIRSDLDRLTASVATALQTITHRIDKVEEDYKKADADIYVFFLAKIAEIQEEIQHIVLEDVTVINPVTKMRDTIQNTLNDIFMCVTAWTLTAAEYDALNLSADGYDGLGLTAFQYDFMSRYYLMEKPDIIERCQDYTDNEVANLADVVYTLREDFDDCCETVQAEINNNASMFSPFHGRMETVKDVIYELTELARAEAVTATYYDGLEMTATDYDGRQITAFNYDWHASAYLI